MSQNKLDISLCPASGDSVGFIFEIFSATHREEFLIAGLPEAQLRQILKMQFTAQQTQYRTQYPESIWELIVQDVTPIGYWCVARLSDAIVLVDLAISPECSGSGIGTDLLGRLIREAASAVKPVQARVRKGNRAINLYRRLGFEVVADEDVYLQIERPVAATKVSI